MASDDPEYDMSAIGLRSLYRPPPDFPRYRPLLYTAEVVPCKGAWAGGCKGGRTAEWIWFGGLPPACPVCGPCYEENRRFEDSACGVLARLDEAGIWRPCNQNGDIMRSPYAFDW